MVYLKGGYISTSDTEVKNYGEIRFVDSVYNGEYKVFDVTNETFKISPLIPEFYNILRYWLWKIRIYYKI